VKLYMQHVIPHYRLPKKIILDQDTHSQATSHMNYADSWESNRTSAWLTSAKINISYSILFNLTTSYSSYFGGKKGISRNKTSFCLLMYHPQTDGQSKQTNQSLEQYLRIVCRKDQHSWADWLPLAQYVWNLWPSSTTKKTPYELILSYTPHVHQPT